MSNECQIVIKQGQNKGKKCCEVHKWCMHKVEKCPHCQQEFAYVTTLKRHIKTCSQNPAASVKQKIEIKPMAPVMPAATPAIPTISPEYRALCEQIGVLASKLDQIDTKVAEVGAKAMGNITIQNNFNFVGVNAYQSLVELMGHRDAVEFITQSALSQKPLEIFRKLYIDNRNPDNYPFAKKGKNLRYLDENGSIVDDYMGQRITKEIKRQVQTAMLMATNDLINSSMRHNTVDQLYDIYDLGKLQSYIVQMNNDFMINGLSEEFNRFENPHHPFFTSSS